MKVSHSHAELIPLRNVPDALHRSLKAPRRCVVSVEIF
jgi:hypothetical protein